MRQLVGQEPAAFRRLRSELPAAEDDVRSDGVGEGTDRCGRPDGAVVGMHAHPRQVVPPVSFEPLSRVRIEGTPR